MDLYSITDLRAATLQARIEGRLHVQVEAANRKETREGKPFWEVLVADAAGRLTLRAWSDAPAFALCSGLRAGSFIEVSGEFSQGGSFGLESKRWTCRDLSPEEKSALLEGPLALREKQAADYQFLLETSQAIADPRLHALCATFFRDLGDRMRRTAAARNNHHARRGGLVEHTAQMLRTAVLIAQAYPALNRDLLVAGVIFHDCGKLWENALPEDGFVMPYTETAELLGHIPIGIEIVNRLWRKIMTEEAARVWAPLTPSNEDVRLHLLHLVASHHGSLEFGSPVVPKTPEAVALHYIDNLDAKLEMIFAGYESARMLGPNVFEKTWPLQGNLVAPLRQFGA